jgi:hypothetical protein
MTEGHPVTIDITPARGYRPEQIRAMYDRFLELKDSCASRIRELMGTASGQSRSPRRTGLRCEYRSTAEVTHLRIEGWTDTPEQAISLQAFLEDLVRQAAVTAVCSEGDSPV